MAVPQRTLTLLRRLARSNGTTADATVRALTASWLTAWDDLAPGWQQAIAGIVEQYERTGAWPSPWQIARIEAIAAAQHKTEQTLTRLLTDADRDTRSAATRVSEATARTEPAIIGSQRAGLDVADAPSRDLAATLAARHTRITGLFRPLLDDAGGAIRRTLNRPPNLSQGIAPVAGTLLDHVRNGFDAPLIRSSTIVRTETADTYRTAAALVHDTNRQILTAWCWHCSCDRRSCSACWAMHGRSFPLEQPGPLGHPGCRCTRLPLAIGADLPSAEARFGRLSRRD